MTGSYDLRHADGTTTVIEVDDDGNYYVYTTDSSTGERIDDGPSNEIGSNYSLEEVLDSYRRADDVPSDTSEDVAGPAATEPDPATVEPGAMDPSDTAFERGDEPSEVEPDSEEPGSADGG
ncbi:hypothetical protein [Caballeronia sp. GaOx3]|uniref:hypothetical protein n=1 Tax=Caballeronia sp. GaOx3 TaxID=2921740 RepID=UPI0020286DFE|nr:hypothetical protein [Caballeronia sp. GaOx3]